MCDIYGATCEKCAREIEVHIGDYCVPRSAVRVYCPSCTTFAIKAIEEAGPEGVVVFADTESEEGLHYFLLHLKDGRAARGIHVNG